MIYVTSTRSLPGVGASMLPRAKPLPRSYSQSSLQDLHVVARALQPSSPSRSPSRPSDTFSPVDFVEGLGIRSINQALTMMGELHQKGEISCSHFTNNKVKVPGNVSTEQKSKWLEFHYYITCWDSCLEKGRGPVTLHTHINMPP